MHRGEAWRKVAHSTGGSGADGREPGWGQVLERCQRALSALPEVRALVVTGSGATGADMDRWSDLDLVVVTADAAAGGFASAVEWLAPIGEVYALDTSVGPDRETVRVCFTNLRRVDFLFVRQSALAVFAAAPGPLQAGARVLLDRTGGALGEALRGVPGAASPDPDAAEDAFRSLERGFRWNGVLAAAKVGRGDLLIGAHLALEMAQACLVLGMLLRDRALGTRHHRRGDGAVPPLRLPSELTAEGVADLIAASCACWEALGVEWDPAYVFPKAPMLALLGRAPGEGVATGGPRRQADH